jgi:hypothetical protein
VETAGRYLSTHISDGKEPYAKRPVVGDKAAASCSGKVEQLAHTSMPLARNVNATSHNSKMSKASSSLGTTCVVVQEGNEG